MSFVSGDVVVSPISSSVVTIRVPKSTQFLFIACIFVIILSSYPVSCGEDESSEEVHQNGNFSQSPKNHEEVLARNKDSMSSSNSRSSSSGDDYWVGSDKMEFKPHPLLMPSTLAPTSQIPIPIIELGTPPTTPTPFGDEEDIITGPPTVQSQGNKKKGKKKNKKKSRDQRRLAHRTLWATTSAGTKVLVGNKSNGNSGYMPIIISGGSGAPTSLVIPRSRNDDSFHGSASTWNINHPNNNMNNFNNAAQQQKQQGSGSGGGSIHAYPHNTAGLSQYQQLQLAQAFQQSQSPQQQLQQQNFIPQQLPFPMQMSTGPDSTDFNFQQFGGSFPGAPQSQGGIGGGGQQQGKGPYLVYVPPAAAAMAQAQLAQASGPLPVKQFGINDIPMDFGTKPMLFGEDETTHAHHHHQPHLGSTPHPHYFRNNILRVVMDKLASVGKSLPIPFVTKYSSPPQQSYGHSHHSHHHGMQYPQMFSSMPHYSGRK